MTQEAQPPVASSPDAGIGLALGAGGARGLAHLVVLEALDELGVRPARIVGVSIGAIVGAAYAAGLPARFLRAFVLASFRDRARVAAKLLDARVGKLADLISRSGIGNPVLVDGERLLDQFWPREVPDRFEDLRIPFAALATDYHLRTETVFASGPLTPAVAASMAWPGLVKPVVMEGRVLIDGGAVTPLPVAHAAAGGLATLCVDVSGASFMSDARVPEPVEAMFGASQILMTAVAQHAVSRHEPGLVVRPDVGRFGGLDFFRADEILRAAEPVKDRVKQWVDKTIGR